MKRLLKTKTIHRYIVSYVGVALLSCALVGIVLFTSAVSQMKKTYEDLQTERLQIAADLLETNLELMQETVYRVQLSAYFRRAYLEQNNYNASVMLDHLARFENAVPISEEYFLYYRGGDLVYKVGDRAASNAFPVYVESNLRSFDCDDLYTKVNALAAPEVILSARGDITLMAYPVKLSAEANDGAVLCFILRKEKLFQYLHAAAGEMNGELHIALQGTPILPGTAQDKQISAVSQEGSVVLALDPDMTASYGRLDHYYRFSYLFTIGVTVLMLGLAVYAAYQSYRPIKELVMRFSPEMATGDALQSLSSKMGELFEQNQVSTQELQNKVGKLDQQRQTIQRQLVHLILCGQHGIQTERLLQELDPRAKDRLYSVLVVQPEQFKASSGEVLVSLVEDLSDDSASLYGIVLRNAQSAAFLCLSDDSEEVGEISDLVEAVCAEAGMQVRCGVGTVHDSIGRMPLSLLEALSAAQDPSVRHTPADARYREVLHRRLLHEMENANTEQALRCFSRLTERIMENESFLSRLSAFSDLINSLIHAARGWDLQILDERLHMVALLQDPDRFCALARDLIQRICQGMALKTHQQDAATGQEILLYVQENVSDYTMTLDKISGEFNVSVKRVSQLVREASGLAYKDYLKEVRVEKACRLLAQEKLSVAQTCAQVGLTEVSYFIRVFKSVTGETPANYRRQHVELEETDIMPCDEVAGP